MASYQVFIERAKDNSPQGIARVAAAIAARYGLPAEALQQRMSQGRFRAKGNVDLETANTFAKDLDRLGAVCSIEDAQGNKVGEAAPAAAPSSGFPAVGLSGAQTPPSAGLPPVAAPQPPSPKPSTSGIGAAPAKTKTPPGGYQSGLAAAFGDEASRGGTDLGALGAADSAAFSLASLDGSEELAVDDSPMSQAPAAVAADDPSAIENRFRPPEEAGGAPKALELAVAAPVRKTPPPMPAVSASGEHPLTPPPRTTGGPISAEQPVVAAVPKESPVKVVTRALGNKPRVRLLAGVILAILLGFIPATLIASWQEGTAYADSRKEIHKVYADVRTVEDWKGLDEVIKGELGVMNSSRQKIAITSILVWGAAGGGFAFLWFRKVPWDNFTD